MGMVPVPAARMALEKAGIGIPKNGLLVMSKPGHVEVLSDL